MSGVDVPSRGLITVGPDHPVWSGGWPEGDRWDGAIVRIRPPDDVDAGLLEKVRQAFVTAGATRVRVERRRSAPLPEAVHERRAAPSATARQVVEELVDALDDPDKNLVRFACARLMDEEGL